MSVGFEHSKTQRRIAIASLPNRSRHTAVAGRPRTGISVMGDKTLIRQAFEAMDADDSGTLEEIRSNSRCVGGRAAAIAGGSAAKPTPQPR